MFLNPPNLTHVLITNKYFNNKIQVSKSKQILIYIIQQIFI